MKDGHPACVNCPENLIWIEKMQECALCVEGCLTCENKPENCTSCKTDEGYHYDEELNQCFEKCPSNKYIDYETEDEDCERCHKDCLECNGPTMLDCT